MTYMVIWLPKHLEERLPFSKYPRLRVDARIGGICLNCAFQIGGKRRYILISSDFMKQAGLALSKKTKVEFSIADQNAVDVPYELELALSRNPLAKSRWDGLTPGKKRGYVHRINSAKKQETVEKRVEELIERLLG